MQWRGVQGSNTFTQNPHRGKKQDRMLCLALKKPFLSHQGLFHLWLTRYLHEAIHMCTWTRTSSQKSLTLLNFQSCYPHIPFARYPTPQMGMHWPKSQSSPATSEAHQYKYWPLLSPTTMGGFLLLSGTCDLHNELCILLTNSMTWTMSSAFIKHHHFYHFNRLISEITAWHMLIIWKQKKD